MPFHPICVFVRSTLEKLVKLGGDVNELFDFPPVDSFRGGFRPDIHAENYFQTFSHVKVSYPKRSSGVVTGTRRALLQI